MVDEPQPQPKIVSQRIRNWARAGVLFDVEDELIAQKAKHGTNEMFYSPDKLAILIEEVGEVGHALNEHMTPSEVYKELIQVAACATAWAEWYRCQEYNPDGN